MTTLTALEDRIQGSNDDAQKALMVLSAARYRLTCAMARPITPEEYQHFALLLEAVIQSEDIIKTIYFRYHNTALGAEVSQ